MSESSPDAPPHGPPSPDALALALSAGGARGAYQMGCWRAFLDRGLNFAAASGSSIGALNSVLIAQGDWAQASELWMELTDARILKPEYHRLRKLAVALALDLGLLLAPVPNFRLLKVAKYLSAAMRMGSSGGAVGVLRSHGVADLVGFKPLLEKRLDLARALARPLDVLVTVSGWSSSANPLGPARWFRLRDMDLEGAWNVLAASMAIPFVFAPIEVNGARYVDGGVGQWLPISPLEETGFRRIIAVSVKASYKLPPNLQPETRVLLIKPEKSLGRFPVATFRFTKDAVKAWLEQGYVDASRILEQESL